MFLVEGAYAPGSRIEFSGCLVQSQEMVGFVCFSCGLLLVFHGVLMYVVISNKLLSTGRNSQILCVVFYRWNSRKNIQMKLLPKIWCKLSWLI
jgi:hypothetical protein